MELQTQFINNFVFPIWACATGFNNNIIISTIIKKGRQCKAESDIHPIRSKTPSPTIPTNRQKEEKGEKSRSL